MKVELDKSGNPTFDGRTHPFRVGDILEVTRGGVTRDAIVSKVSQDGVEFAEVIKPKRKVSDEEYEYVLAKLSLAFKGKEELR